MVGPEHVGAREICVLVPVHRGTSAPHLAAALDSLRHQTLRAGEVLLVEDGELTEAHRAVVEHAAAGMPELTVLRPGAVGLVGALNAGLDRSAAPWIARMDADDVAEPERLDRQAAAASEGDVDVIGSAVLEFAGDPASATVVRRVPQDHADIVRAMRTVNPVHHPTVLVRREAVLAAGGYQPLSGMEDYWLWARMASRGARFRNLPEPLVRFRADDGLLRRRADRSALLAEWQLQRNLRAVGMVGPLRSAANLVVRVGFRLLPRPAMRAAYAVVRRLLARGHRAD